MVWVLCWFIAALDWAIAQASMNAFITHYVLDKDLRKSYCNDVLNNIPGSYAQAAIADVSARGICVSSSKKIGVLSYSKVFFKF